MKSKFFTVCLLGALLLLISCDPKEPVLKEVTPEACLEALTKYFPYSAIEHFVFYNDSLKHEIEVDAFDESQKGIYPMTTIHQHDDYTEEKGCNWSSQVDAYMFNSNIDHNRWKEHIYAFIREYTVTAYSEESLPIHMYWKVDLRLSESTKPQEYFSGLMQVWCTKEQLSSLLTDTITLPIKTIYTQSIENTTTDGSYVRIVRNVGIYDFSLDGGKTSWKRIKANK